MCSDVLEELDLSWCRGVSGPALGMLADSCPKLRKLRLFGCSQVPPLSACSLMCVLSAGLGPCVGCVKFEGAPEQQANMRGSHAVVCEHQRAVQNLYAVTSWQVSRWPQDMRRQLQRVLSLS